MTLKITKADEYKQLFEDPKPTRLDRAKSAIGKGAKGPGAVLQEKARAVADAVFVRDRAFNPANQSDYETKLKTFYEGFQERAKACTLEGVTFEELLDKVVQEKLSLKTAEDVNKLFDLHLPSVVDALAKQDQPFVKDAIELTGLKTVDADAATALIEKEIERVVGFYKQPTLEKQREIEKAFYQELEKRVSPRLSEKSKSLSEKGAKGFESSLRQALSNAESQLKGLEKRHKEEKDKLEKELKTSEESVTKATNALRSAVPGGAAIRTTFALKAAAKLSKDKNVQDALTGLQECEKKLKTKTSEKEDLESKQRKEKTAAEEELHQLKASDTDAEKTRYLNRRINTAQTAFTQLIDHIQQGAKDPRWLIQAAQRADARFPLPARAARRVWQPISALMNMPSQALQFVGGVKDRAVKGVQTQIDRKMAQPVRALYQKGSSALQAVGTTMKYVNDEMWDKVELAKEFASRHPLLISSVLGFYADYYFLDSLIVCAALERSPLLLTAGKSLASSGATVGSSTLSTTFNLAREASSFGLSTTWNALYAATPYVLNVSWEATKAVIGSSFYLPQVVKFVAGPFFGAAGCLVPTGGSHDVPFPCPNLNYQPLLLPAP